MAGRADRLVSILKDNDGRLHVQQLLEKLTFLEHVGSDDLHQATVASTVRQDNRTREQKGQAKRFRVYGDGEQRGYVSLVPTQEADVSIASVLKKPDEGLPRLVESANVAVKEKLKEEINKLTWRQFESNFLSQVLEALGFTDVEITQPTRDAGQDAVCMYRRGIVKSQAIVSAKHWLTVSVGPPEVLRLRGIDSAADTGIIVTSTRFTRGAVEEAGRGRNQRSIFLVDGDMIVEACVEQGIGVEKTGLPSLLRLSTPLIPQDLDPDTANA